MTWNDSADKIGRGTKVGYHTHNICGYSLTLTTTESLLWPLSTAYTFPSAAAATTIVSTDTKDDLTGVGARSAYVSGLDSNWDEINETIDLDGTTPVTLANQYVRVGEVYIIDVGSELDNAGTIHVKHGSTIIQAIAIGDNRYQSALHSVPRESDSLFLKLSLDTGKTDEIIVRFKFKPFGLPVQTLHTSVMNANHIVADPVIPKNFPAKSDIFVTAAKTTGTNGQVSSLMCIADVRHGSRVRGI